MKAPAAHPAMMEVGDIESLIIPLGSAAGAERPDALAPNGGSTSGGRPAIWSSGWAIHWPTLHGAVSSGGRSALTSTSSHSAWRKRGAALRAAQAIRPIMITSSANCQVAANIHESHLWESC